MFVCITRCVGRVRTLASTRRNRGDFDWSIARRSPRIAEPIEESETGRLIVLLFDGPTALSKKGVADECSSSLVWPGERARVATDVSPVYICYHGLRSHSFLSFEGGYG